MDNASFTSVEVMLSAGKNRNPPKPCIWPFVKKRVKKQEIVGKPSTFCQICTTICPQTDFDVRNSNFEFPKSNFEEKIFQNPPPPRISLPGMIQGINIHAMGVGGIMGTCWFDMFMVLLRNSAYFISASSCTPVTLACTCL